MYLYHGTDKKSAQSILNNGINIHKCRKRLDFGIGFYTTQNLTDAKEWSNKKQNSIRYGSCVIKYKFNYNAYKPLVTRFKNDKEWAEFVILNRKRVFYHSNIITQGKIADGEELFYNINQLFEKLNSGFELTEQEIKCLMFKKETEQIVFHNKKALETLKYCDIIE